MQFELVETEGTDDETDAVAPGTSCTVFPCGGLDPMDCTCPGC